MIHLPIPSTWLRDLKIEGKEKSHTGIYSFYVISWCVYNIVFVLSECFNFSLHMYAQRSNFLPSYTFSVENCHFPSKKGGMFSSILSFCNRSIIVKPQSAIMEMPGLSSSVVRKPDIFVSSTSEIEPTKT